MVYELPGVAGGRTKILENESTAACLELGERPVTPNKIRKWRKSRLSEPGRRVLHPGLADDVKAYPSERFGKLKVESDHVENVWEQPGARSEYAQVKLEQKECVYASTRREQLGKSYNWGHEIPNKDATFGKSTALAEDDAAKKLIYQPAEPESHEASELYKKSHNALAPGEQKRRGYDWQNKNIDLIQHRFGTNTHSYSNGTSHGATEVLRPPSDIYEEENTKYTQSHRVQNFKALQDKLGQSRALGHTNVYQLPRHHVYGKASVRGLGQWDARQCIRGDYSEQDTLPDADLGTSHTPGFRNHDIPPNKALGIATTRSDQNASSLLFPSLLTSMGLDDHAFSKARSKDELAKLFPDLNPQQFDDIYDRAAHLSGGNPVSLDTFRRVYIETKASV